MGLVVTVLLFGLIATIQAQTPDALKAIDRFFTAIKAEALYTNQIKTVVDAQVKKNPKLGSYRAQIDDAINKNMSWSLVKKDIGKIYVREFTADDLNKIADFYQTPAGTKLFEKMTDQKISWSKILEDPTLMTEMFSETELTEIVQFMQTPAGLKLAEKMPVLTKKTEDFLKQKAQKTIDKEAKKTLASMMKNQSGKVRF